MCTCGLNLVVISLHFFAEKNICDSSLFNSKWAVLLSSPIPGRCSTWSNGFLRQWFRIWCEYVHNERKCSCFFIFRNEIPGKFSSQSLWSKFLEYVSRIRTWRPPQSYRKFIRLRKSQSVNFSLQPIYKSNRIFNFLNRIYLPDSTRIKDVWTLPDLIGEFCNDQVRFDWE